MRTRAMSVLLCILLALVEVHSQTAPYLTFMNNNIPNHSYVDLNTVTGGGGPNELRCNTDLVTCCTSAQGDDRGNWYYPNGNELGYSTDVSKGANDRRVVLYKRHVGAPSGIYRCDIETNAVNNNTGNESIYVGLYTSGGDVTIPDGMTFTENSDLNGGSPRFTLTCISTSGPATNVTWTRDPQTVSGEMVTVLNSAVSAQYTHTLTLTGKESGKYRCTVANNKPSSTSAELMVEVASPPTNLTAVQEGPTGIRVSWTPPTPLKGTTGYRIYYSGGSSGSKNATDSSTDSLLLTGLKNGASYSISIVSTSKTIPSDSVVNSMSITLVPPPGKPTVTVDSKTSTTITLSWTTSNGTAESYEVTWMRNGTVYNNTIGGDSTGYIIKELESNSSYTITVTATNAAGSAVSDTITGMTREAGSGSNRGGSSKSNAGPAVGGVFAALIVVALVVAGVVIAVIWWRRRSRETSSHQKPQDTVQYKPKPDAVMTTKPSKPPPPKASAVPSGRSTAPLILKFPEETHAEEGEAVLFQVKVSGTPQPTLTWYHNRDEVEVDYSRELAEDGSLTLPSVEARHTGTYKMVAQNSAGRKEKEVKLIVLSENAQPKKSSSAVTVKAVPVSMFGDRVEQNHARGNRGFRDEYEALYDGEDMSVSIATTSTNRLKNRFANICVYDSNRVVLKPLEGHDDCQSDYINASYVDGYSRSKEYLCTQGPLPKTLVDFWRLVWQERPPSIVMITNVEEGGKVKCQKYWPESGNRSFGPFQVSISDQQPFADYVIRTLTVTLSGSSGRPLKVTQFHFTAWPDHGVPDYATPILAFHRRVKKEHRPSKGPMMVHCSAGVGRTGTFITIDQTLEQVEKEKVVNIAQVINNIRGQRMKMVQTLDQYSFIHDAILESVMCGDTQINTADLRNALRSLQASNQMEETGFHHQFNILDKVSPNPAEAKAVTARKNRKNNRFDQFLPADRWRVQLERENPDYIFASAVNGYKQHRAFIIAQGPMQSTARDFWKMVYDKKCGVIVMLSDLVEGRQEVCYQYWPNSGSQNYGEFTVEMLGEERLQGHVLRTVSLQDAKSGNVHQVSQFHITNWAPDGSCSNLKTVTDVIDEVGKVQRRTGNRPIVVHCSDTVSRSGMFCAMATTIERCKTEGVVDVFQVVKALRVQKPGAVRTAVQYRIIFEAVLVFLDSFDNYANF